ncbi:MAG: HAD-IIIA family hydrolase [Desulfobacterium sp.]|nr:HAD-IIIA family hydrolase [Desulfobacterium sp.]
MNHPSDVQEKLSNLKLLLLDVDGVLTRGTVTYTDQGDEIKSFSVKDGLGLRLLMDAGIRVGIITGRRSNALVARCNNLGIDLLFDGIIDKVSALEAILAQTGITAGETAFAGDDLPDLCVMKRVGLAITVFDASPDVKKVARIITPQRGGEGAIRQVCEDVLKSKGLWDGIVARFSQ